MPYWRLFYHLVWATKHRAPLLTPEAEPNIHELLRTKAIGLSATVFAIGGTEDHTHMIVSIPPRIAVAELIGQVKGASSARFNRTGISSTPFAWQAEYGAFSFDTKRLANFISYVNNQKEHHRSNTIIPALERTEERPTTPTLREPTHIYHVEDEAWRQQMLALD